MELYSTGPIQSGIIGLLPGSYVDITIESHFPKNPATYTPLIVKWTSDVFTGGSTGNRIIHNECQSLVDPYTAITSLEMTIVCDEGGPGGLFFLAVDTLAAKVENGY